MPTRAWVEVLLALVGALRLARGDRGEIRELRRNGGFGAGFPAGRQRPRYPVGVQLRPGAVGDDGVQPGVQRRDQRLVVFRHAVGDEVAPAERVGGDEGGVTRADHLGRLHRRRHPSIDLVGLDGGVQGGEIGELDRLHMQFVDDVGLFDSALDDPDPLAGV